MAASRSSRVTRSSVGINGLDENFCGRTLRNRSIAQPEEGAGAGSTAAAVAAGAGAGVVPRSRSPKKPGGQQGKLAESKAASPAAAAADGGEQQQQQGALPRKRGVSVSERDGAAAGGEKGGAQRDSSSSPPPPPLKRAKRCPPAPPRPPGEPPQEEHEDDGPPPPAAADSPPAPPSPQAPAALKENNNRDDSTPGHAASSSSPRLGKEEDEEEEEEPEPPPQNHAHKASNGLGENGENGEKDGQPCGDPSPPDDDNAVATGNNSPALLLNGSQEEVAASSSPEPIVPCTTNSVPEEEEEEEEELCASSGEVPASPLAPPPPPPSHAPEEIPAVREAGLGEVGLGEAGLKEAGLEEAGPEEVELDVVGDSACVAHEEEVVSTSNGPAPDSAPSSSSSCSSSSSFTAINNANDGPVVNNSNDNNNNDDNNNSNDNNNSSGEAALPAPAPPEPGHAPQASGVTPPPSFVEPHEHRYTLRTSPRRAGGGVAAGALGGGAKPGGSSSSPPPPRDNNGPLRGDEGAESLGAAAHKEEEREVKGPARLKEEEEEKEEDHAPSDPRVSVDPGARGGGGVSAAPAAASREARAGKEAAAAEEEEEEEQEEEEEEEEEEEPDVYYFESDHLALKHNKDYQRLLQTIGVLEAQRTQAVLDLEQLSRHQRAALSQPIGFVEQLQKQAALGLPRPQRVVQLPDIPWGQYTAGLGDFERELCDRKRKTRRLQLVFDKVGLPVRPKSPLEPKKEGESSTMYSALPSSDAPENSRQAQMIRGRLCHQSKPDTFNQLWTVEEQKKLEQLLLKFPPEEVESKRWQKIADELGDRTSKQVASRVQKYFIKLTKAGIPVPGRTPNMCMYSKKASSKRQHHLNKHLYRQSTFLTSYEPPVYMDEEDERSAFYGGLQDQSADDSDEEGVPLECRHLPEYKELLELKRLRRRRLQDLHDDGAAQHPGYKCDVCGVEPIQGVRWHCQDCPPDNAVDFCTNCSDCLFQTETHKPGHHLTPVYQSEESFLDRDYCLPQTPGYNYLDPNYYPANR